MPNRVPFLVTAEKLIHVHVDGKCHPELDINFLFEDRRTRLTSKATKDAKTKGRRASSLPRVPITRSDVGIKKSFRSLIVLSPSF